MTGTLTWTIDAIKAMNKAQGYHYFSPATMKFFRSKVSRKVYQGPGGVYIVTSEQFVSSTGKAEPRCYTVRKFNPETGDINTCGPFNVMSPYEAAKYAKELANTAPKEDKA